MIKDKVRSRKADNIIGMIFIVPLLIVNGLFLVFMLLPIGGLFYFMDKLFGVKEQPIDESEWYRSGGRGYLH